jgi:hypothetical protein
MTHELLSAYNMLDKMHILVRLRNPSHCKALRTFTGSTETETSDSRSNDSVPHGRVCSFSEESHSRDGRGIDFRRPTM